MFLSLRRELCAWATARLRGVTCLTICVYPFRFCNTYSSLLHTFSVCVALRHIVSPLMSFRFYVVRGQVEKEYKTEDGCIECVTHSSGLLFGITDAMLAW